MELEHRFTVPSTVEVTWAAFNDLEMIAPCFPGATLTSADADGFTGSVKIKLGPIALQYNGSGTFLERDEAAHTAVIEARGRDKRGNGTATATVRARLSPDGEQTFAEVTTDLAITGKPAQFGRGVIQDVSDKLLGQFVACLQDKLSAPTPGGAAGTPPVDAEGVTKDPSVGESAPLSASAPGVAESMAAPAPTASGAPTTPAAPPAPSTAPAPAAPAAEVQLNLLGAIGPVLLKRFGPALLVALGGVVVGFWAGRRRNRRN